MDNEEKFDSMEGRQFPSQEQIDKHDKEELEIWKDQYHGEMPEYIRPGQYSPPLYIEPIFEAYYDEKQVYNLVSPSDHKESKLEKIRRLNQEEARRDDSNKPDLTLIPYDALVEIAKVFEFGANKYGRHNFYKGMHWTRVLASAHRHLGKFQSGEDLDPESGLSHLAHLGCNVIMLLLYQAKNLGRDNRYKFDKNN